MSFFADEEPPEPPPIVEYRPPPWSGVPENVLPASVALDVVLVRTDRVGVAICGARAYPDGVAFAVQILRQEPPDPRDRFRAPFHFHGPRERGDLRLGVGFADGRRAVLGEGHRVFDRGQAPDIVVVEAGGGGGMRHWHGRCWLWPLPPEGPLTFACAWTDEGVEETSVVVDAAPIRAAAARAIELWPDDRPDPPRRDPDDPGWSSYAVSGRARLAGASPTR